MLNILTNPVQAIGESRTGGIGKVMGVLGVSSLLAGLAAALFLKFSAGSLLVAAGGVLSIFAGGLLIGYLLQVTGKILTDQGNFKAGLTSISYSLLPASIGLVLAAGFSYIPVAGAILAFLVGSIFFVIAQATFLRAVKDLHATDYIVAVVALIVVWTGLILGIYSGFFGILAGIAPVVPLG